MDVFKFAMDKEKYSELYYRDLAERTANAGLKNILTMLADDEAEHLQAIERLKAGVPKKTMSTSILANARKVFERMRKAGEKFDFHMSEADLYAKAMKIEEESKRFYLKKAKEATDPDQKEILEKLAQEEDRHLVLMENLHSFVSRPETYLEDAEFCHFDDYVDGEF